MQLNGVFSRRTDRIGLVVMHLSCHAVLFEDVRPRSAIQIANLATSGGSTGWGIQNDRRVGTLGARPSRPVSCQELDGTGNPGDRAGATVHSLRRLRWNGCRPRQQAECCPEIEVVVSRLDQQMRVATPAVEAPSR